eukprot:713876-Rhodomonas_salina.4
MPASAFLAEIVLKRCRCVFDFRLFRTRCNLAGSPSTKTRAWSRMLVPDIAWQRRGVVGGA